MTTGPAPAPATARTAPNTSRSPTPARTATSTASWMTGPSMPGSEEGTAVATGAAAPPAAGPDGDVHRLLDDRALHAGVGVGHADLHGVGPALDQRDHRLDRARHVGVADREVAEQRGPARAPPPPGPG